MHILRQIPEDNYRPGELSTRRTVALSNCRPVELSPCRTIALSNYRPVELSPLHNPHSFSDFELFFEIPAN
jgi:hypothetical protein